MDQTELRGRLKNILDSEERGDWAQVDGLSDELNRELVERKFGKCPEIVAHFLDDADIRARDNRYGERQRREVRRFVDTGEYKDSTSIPLWSCTLVAALIIAAIIWLVN